MTHHVAKGTFIVSLQPMPFENAEAESKLGRMPVVDARIE